MAGALGDLADGKPRWLAYAPDTRKDYLLMEVDSALLEELQNGGGAAFKSEPDGAAVLCTASRTFNVKSVETTNLLMLLPPSQDEAGEDVESTPPGEPAESQGGMATQAARNETADTRKRVVVTATADRHFELVETAPKMGVLMEMLAENPYCGDEDRNGGRELGYTFEELLESVPCGEQQLREALRTGNAIELAGRWRSVSELHMSEVLQLLLLSAVEHDWPVSAVPGTAAVSVLEPEGYPSAIVLHCLRSFSESGEETGSEGASSGLATTYSLDKRKVCQSFARSLLATSPRWSEAEFMAAWRRSVPTQEVAPSKEMLRGIAILVGPPADPCVQRFDAATLPRNPAERFRALFNTRASWLWEDLEPYLTGLEAGNASVEAVLLRYARAVQKTPSDPVTYTAR